jgi:hypothetical protein
VKRPLPGASGGRPSGGGTEESSDSDEGGAMSPEQEAMLQVEIDRNLRLVYRDTLDAPVPERFLDLIARLRGLIDMK